MNPNLSLRQTLLLSAMMLACPALLTGQHYALLIAVEQYQNTQIEKAPNALQEAAALGAVLSARFGYQVEILENPTAKEVEDKLEEYRSHFARERFKSTGHLLVHFIGRGAEESGAGYFLPTDADPSQVGSTALSWAKCLAAISRFNCRHILVVGDAEHSFAIGSGGEGSSMPTPKDFGESGRPVDYYKLYACKIMLSLSPDGNLERKSPGLTALFRKELNRMGQNNSTVFLSKLMNYLQNRAGSTGSVQAYGFEGDLFRSNFAFTVLPVHKEAAKPPQENESLWKLVKEQNTLEAYSFYYQLYPDGRYGKEAMGRIESFPDNWRTVDGRYWEANSGPSASGQEGEGLSFISGGTFQPGSADGQGQSSAELVIPDFYLSSEEVTFGQFREFYYSTLGKLPPGYESGPYDQPATHIDWYDALEYCNWISREWGLAEVYTINKIKEDPDNLSLNDDKLWIVTPNWRANGYRLPTRAEWEYVACKGRQSDGYRGSYSSSASRYRDNTYGLGEKVLEWCWDWELPGYYDKAGQVSQPMGPKTGALRACRGNAGDDAQSEACADSQAAPPSWKRDNLGFRLARSTW